jgi:transcriptional regulator with XRE-family HTH domain
MPKRLLNVEQHRSINAAMSMIRDLRKKIGMTQQQLAELVGTSQPQIKRLEKGQRTLSKDWAERLAPHLRVTAEHLMFEKPLNKHLEVTGLRVMGIIKAGDWKDISILGDDNTEPEVFQVARDPRFPRADQYLLKVEGDSMNEMFPDGSYVICVNFADSGLSLKTGQIVHVERTLAETHLVETTLKQVNIQGPRQISLRPRSTNPVHKEVILDGDESIEVRVRGIITGKYEPIAV